MTSRRRTVAERAEATRGRRITAAFLANDMAAAVALAEAASA